MSNDLLTTFESIETGDKISVPQYSNPLEVTDVHESIGNVELRGPRGGEKSLVQNKHNPEDIALMTGADRKGFVTELERL